MSQTMLQRAAAPRTIDATTREGFLELVRCFGRAKAHESRVATYRSLYEANKDFRSFGDRYLRAWRGAMFERDYEAANQRDCEMMRKAGIGY